MDVALKIWRYNPQRGERELREYEVDAPEWACLLDVLDLIKDKHDGSLAYRKSCRMMICGSCGMRMDGRAILACKERMKPIVDAGHVPVIAPMGNLPVLKDLVVDMEPFWSKIRSVKPWLDSGYDEAAEKERIVSQQQVNAIHKEALCIMCGCCVSECNSMESDPEFMGPAALAKGFRFVGDVRDQDDVGRLNEYNRSTGSGTARAATSAMSAARRASTRATRSPSSAPSRSSRRSTTTWAPSTRSGSSSRPRRRAGCARRSWCRRPRAWSRRSRRSASR